MADIFNQNHSGSGHNIVNLGARRPEMTQAVMNQLLSDLNGHGFSSVQIEGNGANESFAAADQLAEFLKAQGMNVTRNGDADTYLRVPGPNRPFTVYIDQQPPLVLIDMTVLM